MCPRSPRCRNPSSSRPTCPSNVPHARRGPRSLGRWTPRQRRVPRLPTRQNCGNVPPPPSLQCGPMFSGKLVRCVIDLTGKVNFYTGGGYCFVYTSLLVSAFLCCALRLFCVFRFASSSYSSFLAPVSSSSRVLHIYSFIWCVKWGQMHERNFDVMCTADPHSFYTHMPLLRRATRRRVENSPYPPPIIDSSRFSIPFLNAEIHITARRLDFNENVLALNSQCNNDFEFRRL
jgi:hypothetical protein